MLTSPGRSPPKAISEKPGDPLHCHQRRRSVPSPRLSLGYSEPRVSSSSSSPHPVPPSLPPSACRTFTFGGAGFTPGGGRGRARALFCSALWGRQQGETFTWDWEELRCFPAERKRRKEKGAAAPAGGRKNTWQQKDLSVRAVKSARRPQHHPRGCFQGEANGFTAPPTAMLRPSLHDTLHLLNDIFFRTGRVFRVCLWRKAVCATCSNCAHLSLGIKGYI